jgi:hypothetical protein
MIRARCPRCKEIVYVPDDVRPHWLPDPVQTEAAFGRL